MPTDNPANRRAERDTRSLPPEAAAELAAYLRSQLFAPLSTNMRQLRDECDDSMTAQKEALREAQAQVARIIEPAAEALVPIAEELGDVYRQIELLEGLVGRVNESIRAMATKVEKTEAAIRKEERALNDGKPLPMWGDLDKTKEFRARDWVEGGRLKERDDHS